MKKFSLVVLTALLSCAAVFAEAVSETNDKIEIKALILPKFEIGEIRVTKRLPQKGSLLSYPAESGSLVLVEALSCSLSKLALVDHLLEAGFLPSGVSMISMIFLYSS